MHNNGQHTGNETDGQWISSLFRQYYPLLCLVAHKIVQNHEASEDIVQDCFAKLWQKRKELLNINNNVAYVYTTVRNHAYNYKRDNATTNELSDTAPCNEEHKLHDLIEAETIYQLYQALQTLPPKCRQVFHLYYIEGKTNEEIACRMNITESTVRNQKAKGIVKLRRKLKEVT